MLGASTHLPKKTVKNRYESAIINRIEKQLDREESGWMKKRFPQIDIYSTGQNIKRIMERKGITVKDIQGYLELGTPQSIYHWFAGRNLPTIDNLYALSELFCVPLDILVCGNREVEFCFFNPADKRFIMYYKKYLEFRAAG